MINLGLGTEIEMKEGTGILISKFRGYTVQFSKEDNSALPEEILSNPHGAGFWKVYTEEEFSQSLISTKGKK